VRHSRSWSNRGAGEKRGAGANKRNQSTELCRLAQGWGKVGVGRISSSPIRWDTLSMLPSTGRLTPRFALRPCHRSTCSEDSSTRPAQCQANRQAATPCAVPAVILVCRG
jgi:hypothetical protein